MIYEMDDEIRYRINQNVRYLLSLGSSSTSGTTTNKAESNCDSATSHGSNSSGGSGGLLQPNPDQAHRSIGTYFRLIHAVICARCQTPYDCTFGSQVFCILRLASLYIS